MEQNKNNPNCWLVAWRRLSRNKKVKLLVEQFFAEVGDGKTEFSISLYPEWSRMQELKKDDKGVIVIREVDGSQAVYATFTVTGEPRKMKDTHPHCWEGAENNEGMRALVRCDSHFASAIPASAVPQEDLKFHPLSDGWVFKKPMEVYHRMERAGAR